MRLQTLKPRLATLNTQSMATAPAVEMPRMTGRKLQARRLRLWTKNPYCVGCGRLTEFHGEGFHLDHEVPLFKGGEDEDSNCQVLCLPCHDRKTDEDLDRSYRRTTLGRK